MQLLLLLLLLLLLIIIQLAYDAQFHIVKHREQEMHRSKCSSTPKSDQISSHILQAAPIAIDTVQYILWKIHYL